MRGHAISDRGGRYRHDGAEHDQNKLVTRIGREHAMVFVYN